MAKSGLDPFSKASLELMEDRFSPAQLSRRPRQALAEWLGRRGVTQSQKTADQLKQAGGMADLHRRIWDYAGSRLDRRTGPAQPMALSASTLFLLRCRAQK